MKHVATKKDIRVTELTSVPKFATGTLLEIVPSACENTKSIALVSFPVEQLAGYFNDNEVMAGIVIWTECNDLVEVYNPIKHGGFETVGKKQVMGHKIPEGTMLKDVVNKYNETLTTAVKDTCKFKRISMMDRLAGRYQPEDSHRLSTECIKTYETLRDKWTSHFIADYGYYVGGISGNVSNRYTVSNHDI